MQALFVHGMGRSPLSGWPMLRQLERTGIRTETFGYFVAVERFEAIRDRLAARVRRLASRGDYALIGHSLGGVLLRAALTRTLPDLSPPRRLFLLGSPVSRPRLAVQLRANPIYRAATRDCGAFLASHDRMATAAECGVPATGIAGTRAPGWSRRYFGDTPNDGIVAVPEVTAPWLEDLVLVNVIHTFLPSSRQVAAIVIDRLAFRGR